MEMSKTVKNYRHGLFVTLLTAAAVASETPTFEETK